jgi:hypothetical protein
MKLTILKTLFFSVIASSSLFAQKYDLIGTIEQQNPTCYGQANGSISVTAFGGTEPYSYSWSTGDTTASISNLAAGVYTISIYDADSNMITDNITVGQPDEIVINSTITHVTQGIGNDGEIHISTSGTLPNFSYVWSTSNGSGISSTTLDQSNLSAGEYTLTLTNPNGCSASSNFLITQLIEQYNVPATGVSKPHFHFGGTINNTSNIYPNPSNGPIHIKVGQEVKRIEIFSNTGQRINAISIDENNASQEYTQDLEKGTYFVHFYNNNETPEIKTLVIE